MKRIFNPSKNKLRQVRHKRVRTRIKGTANLPRLSVFRGLRNINLQLVDDENAKTLCSINSRAVKQEKAAAGDRQGKIAIAYLAGKLLAEKAKAKGIGEIVFDRGGYKFHGRVKAVADGARDGGLKF